MVVMSRLHFFFSNANIMCEKSDTQNFSNILPLNGAK